MATGSRRRDNLPGPLYLDASALVKLYVREAGSSDLNRAVLGRTDLLISDRSVTEIVSSLCRRRRERAFETAIAVRLTQALLSHVREGLYRRIDLVSETHREAERLLLSMETVALRAADALHLALAVSGGARSVATYDQRLGAAARMVGLGVFP